MLFKNLLIKLDSDVLIFIMNNNNKTGCYIASTIKRILTHKSDYFVNLLYLRDVFELSLIVLFNEFIFFTLFASMQLVAEK